MKTKLKKKNLKTAVEYNIEKNGFKSYYESYKQNF